MTERSTFLRPLWSWYGALGALAIGVILSSGRGTALWITSCCIPWPPHLVLALRHAAWQHWEAAATLDNPRNNDPADYSSSLELKIATVNVQDFTQDTILPYLEQTYGKDWRMRPLLLQNLWTRSDLADPQRHLSLEGLSREDLVIDYFSDARSPAALVPNARGRVCDVVSNMTTHRLPHKIGSQRILDAHPEWIAEVTPPIVTTMFGNYFQSYHLQPGFLPAMTTVPVFVAPIMSADDDHANNDKKVSSNTTFSLPPHTALHCEPISNIAVQLEGEKQWILVSPEHSHLLRPSLAPDGRAYIASHVANAAAVAPHYAVTTAVGDALWIPTWTWHHVAYTATSTSTNASMALGASLFHFVPSSFVRNNPLFAAFLIPAMIREALGWQRQ